MEQETLNNNTTETQQEAQEAQESNPRDEFLNMLPDEYKQDPAFGNFNDIGSLAKSWKNAQSLIGADKNDVFRIPKDGDLGEVYNRLGRPETADKYETEALQDEKFSEAIGSERIEKFREIAHQNGVSNKAFDSLMLYYKDSVMEDIEKMETNFTETVEKNQQALKKEFGDALQERAQQIDALQNKYGDEDLSSLVSENPHVFTNPAFMRFMAKIAPQFENDGTFVGRTETSSGKLTPAEAKMEIAKIESDPETIKILRNPSHPKRKAFQDQREALYKMAFPSQ